MLLLVTGDFTRAPHKELFSPKLHESRYAIMLPGTDSDKYKSPNIKAAILNPITVLIFIFETA